MQNCLVKEFNYVKKTVIGKNSRMHFRLNDSGPGHTEHKQRR